MNVQWMVPSLPMQCFIEGAADISFPATTGWSWEEGLYTGLAAGREHSLFVTGSGHLYFGSGVTVFDQEGTAAAAVDGQFLLDVIHAAGGKVLVRVVAAPPPPGVANPIWDWLASRLPKIQSICCIGEVEAHQTREWGRRFGWECPVVVVPLGAAVPNGCRVGHPEREGVAYLGRIIPEKRVGFVVEASALAGVPLVLGIASGVNSPEQHAELSRVVERTNGLVGFTSLSLLGRERLLQSVRCVVTASHGDSQWLPGTEIRACGGIAVAERGSLVEQSNGDGMMYHDGTVEDLARVIKRIHEDDAFFKAEAERQHAAFLASGREYKTVGKALWDWVERESK